jgi:hypothetical protein
MSERRPDAPSRGLVSAGATVVILLVPPLEQLDVPAFLDEAQRLSYTGTISVVALGADDALEEAVWTATFEPLGPN